MRSSKRLRVWVFDDYSKISKHAALKIAGVIASNKNEKKRTVLGLATGSSPLGVYRELIKMHREHSIDFSDCVFFNLDEYAGVSRDQLQSYYRFMKENFFEHIGAREEQINVPDGMVAEQGEEKARLFCQEYEAKIKSLGGIDIQLLGLGRNGHIAFNEPGSSIDSRTRVVSLAESTRKDAAPDFFGMKNVPSRALTMGIGTILDARQIVLMASGEHKAGVLRNALEGEPSSRIPASFLQYHDSVEVISDRSAASQLIEFVSPWIVRDVDWKSEPRTATSAMLWLARRKGKALPELDSEDFKSEHLAGLFSARGPLFGAELVNEFASKTSALDRLIGGNTILILSPHPDDDVICTGGTMKLLAESGREVQVAYMVSGSNAVKDADVLNYLALKDQDVSAIVSEYAKSQSALEFAAAVREIVKAIYAKQRGSADDPLVRRIKAEIRKQEALRASLRAGARAHFLNLPFYEEYGSARKAPVSEEDVNIVRELLLRVRPATIFSPGDTTDPNGTHSMCMDAFHSAFSSLAEFAISSEEKEYSKRSGNIPVIEYRGAWQEFTLDDADAIVAFGGETLEAKIEMILEHVSQLDPLFPGPYDDRQFWERARDRNVSFVKLCESVGVRVGGIGAEVFRRSV